MPTKTDVLDRKPLQAINDDIVAARHLQNASSPEDNARMEPGIADMRAQQTAIAVQDYVGALDDPAFADAIAKIDGAILDMRTTALVMRTVTGFINNVAGYVGAAGRVVSALQGA